SYDAATRSGFPAAFPVRAKSSKSHLAKIIDLPLVVTGSPRTTLLFSSLNGTLRVVGSVSTCSTCIRRLNSGSPASAACSSTRSTSAAACIVPSAAKLFMPWASASTGGRHIVRRGGRNFAGRPCPFLKLFQKLSGRRGLFTSGREKHQLIG